MVAKTVASEAGGEPPRPSSNKRQDILDVAVEMLSRGEDLHVVTIAKRAGATQGLIYRYFSDKEQLAAAAYEVIVRGYLQIDLEATAALRGLTREQAEAAVLALWTDIFSPERTSVRWARLEALAHYRTNPQLSEWLRGFRRQLVDEWANAYAEIFDIPDDRLPQLRGVALQILGVAAGFTALGGDDMSDEERHWAAAAATAASMSYLEILGLAWPEE